MSYPSVICYECGLKHGTRRVNQYSSWHQSKCDVCGDDAACTQPRDFGHLKDGWQNERKAAIDSQSEAAQGPSV